MLALRSVARSAPRCARALSTQPLNRCIPNSQASLRHSTVGRWSFLRGITPFSTSIRRLESSGQVNTELSAKLESELAMEKEMGDPSAFPGHIQEYLDNSPFKLQDTTGVEEVVLSRKFGDEKIIVTFSIDDLNNQDEESDSMQEQAMEDEYNDAADMPTDTQSGGATTKGAVNQGQTQSGNLRVAPEDNVAPADRETEEGQEGSEQAQQPGFPVNITVDIERSKKGALQISAVAQDGLIAIDEVKFFKDAKYADPKNAMKEGMTDPLYTGPPFSNLDEDLQVLFEKFLDERGINTTMALFLPEYIDYKEQREYLSWLNGIKGFVDS